MRQRLLIDVADDNAHAFAGQAQNDALTDSLRSSGNNGHLSLQLRVARDKQTVVFLDRRVQVDAHCSCRTQMGDRAMSAAAKPQQTSPPNGSASVMF